MEFDIELTHEGNGRLQGQDPGVDPGMTLPSHRRSTLRHHLLSITWAGKVG